MNFMEALWKSSEVVRGVDSFLKRFPNYHLAALALGMISGAFCVTCTHSHSRVAGAQAAAGRCS
jgi:hypothetical protein